MEVKGTVYVIVRNEENKPGSPKCLVVINVLHAVQLFLFSNFVIKLMFMLFVRIIFVDIL